MPKRVIVDGFNVIRRDSELSRVERGNFYGAQDRLVDQLADYRAGTSHQVTVVFDGTRGPNPYRHRGNRRGVGIIYSASGETADEVIQDLVQSEHGSRSGIMVVTADRALADFCRSERVMVVPPESLLLRSRVSPPRMPTHADFAHGKHEEEGWVGHTQKRGNGRKLPKAKRRPSRLW